MPASPRIGAPGLLLASALAVAFACSDGERAPDVASARQRATVVVSIEPYRWFVTGLAGDDVDVVALLPPGASPLSFEPGMNTLRSLEQASLLVRVGHPHFPFERAWLDGLLRDHPGLPVVDAHHAGAERGAEIDPHEWLAPPAALALVDALEAPIARLTADSAAVSRRAEALRATIRRLDAELARKLGPLAGSGFLVLHPAWGHFAAHYGLEQIALEHEGKAPGPRELAERIDRARARGLRDVIVTPQIDPTQAASVARALGGRIVELDPLASDWPTGLQRTADVVSAASAP